jgi:multiple sugar transport system substrate-binding protein
MSKRGKTTLVYNWHASAQRLGSASVGICLILVLLAGCAKPTPPPEPVAISFAYPEWYGEYFEALIDEFHEGYPHITVELDPIPNSVFAQSFVASDADAFVSGSWSTNLWMTLEQDQMMDLRPFITTDMDFDREDFHMGEAGFLTRGQSVWGVPIGAYLIVMYYNQDLFDQYGAAYPEPGWTWSDFLGAGLALRDPDEDVFGFVPTDSAGAASFVYQHSGQLYDDLQTPTYATYDVPLTVETLEWYTALFLEHNIAPTPEQAQQAFGGDADNATDRAIRRGQVGMWTGGIWQQGRWEDDGVQGFRWGMAPLPRETKAASLSMGEFLFISKGARHPEACWQWISYVSRQMAPEWMAPVRQSQIESEPYEQLVGDEVAAVVRAAASDILIVSPKVQSDLDLFDQAAERVITDGDTPGEALEWAQQQAEKALP